MPAKDNKPFQIRPPRHLVNKLETLAAKHKRESANQLAVEILNDTVEIWAAAMKAYDEALLQQLERAQGMKDKMLQPLRSAQAEQPNTPEVHGRKSRK